MFESSLHTWGAVWNAGARRAGRRRREKLGLRQLKGEGWGRRQREKKEEGEGGEGGGEEAEGRQPAVLIGLNTVPGQQIIRA